MADGIISDNGENRSMPDVVPSDVSSHVSSAEWQARLNCAALYRLMALHGWTDLIFNHITLKVPGESGKVLINPYGWLYEEITASCLITINLDGNVAFNPHGHGTGINYAGYVIHDAIHKARPDVACVIHTHTRAGMAVSAMKCGLLPLTQTAIGCFPVAYHNYEGPAVDVEEQERLIADLGNCNHLVLRNHGLLVCGATAAGAFRASHLFESACAAQVDAMLGGSELVLLSEEIIRRSSMRRQSTTTRATSTDLHWPAMLRMLDRRDLSWRS